MKHLKKNNSKRQGFMQVWNSFRLTRSPPFNKDKYLEAMFGDGG